MDRLASNVPNATITGIDPTVPHVAIFSSTLPSQCSSFFSSNRKFRNTKSKKIPPNAAISAWWLVKCSAY